ncbi:MAG: hypothetical protein QME25_05765 [Bacteroidota bacterium]|nr:hypothetical protein [Bacteroidota bacterium]
MENLKSYYQIRFKDLLTEMKKLENEINELLNNDSTTLRVEDS